LIVTLNLFQGPFILPRHIRKTPQTARLRLQSAKMISAGVEAICRYSDRDDPEIVVAVIFQAMLARAQALTRKLA
jgi:hypothetical protein